MRRAFAVLATAGVAFASLTAGPAQAAQHKGKIGAPSAFYYTTGAEDYHHTLGVTSQAFRMACRLDRLAIANGRKDLAGNIDRFLASPLNGLDGWVVDLKREVTGSFSVKGPGAKEAVYGIPDYDLDLDFYADSALDATTNKLDCADANPIPNGNRSHKCFAHKEASDENAKCITGYKDLKGKLHGARYVLVNAAMNVRGQFEFTLTTP